MRVKWSEGEKEKEVESERELEEEEVEKEGIFCPLDSWKGRRE